MFSYLRGPGDMRRREIHPAETVVRQLPVDMKHGDHVLFAHELERQFPAVSHDVLNDAFIYPNGFLASLRGVFPLSQGFAEKSTGTVRIKQAVRLLLLRVSRLSISKIEQDVFYPCDEHSNGFFHWLSDVLPRIEAFIQRFGMDELRRQVVAIPAMAHFSYTVQSLSPYALPALRIVQKSERLFAKTLSTLTPVAPTGNYRPAVMKTIRQRFRLHFAPEAKSFRKIFLSRNKAARRHIVNEELLWPTLELNGFERVFLEDLTFPEQVALIAEASVFVGLHGAGLTNMLWMEEGSAVVEIRFSGDAQNNCYFSLASALGNPYYYLLAEKDNSDCSAQDANAVVDSGRFTELLRKIAMDKQ